ncbi:unnamed protein product [Eruca vesicaria subsp. sativa]|uniref:Uncharacterized protein n=1 Tax=Eruca vesicaria subsp. sativa TaxID=29727 RepID=A0ABC8L421_ERUVS|nr:unnamed protein product [Eruca vesicaria subsp. sativa]
MSSSASLVSNAAVAYSILSSLRLRRTVQSVVAGLYVHGFIPANRANHYQPSLKTGSIVRLGRLEIARFAHMHKITEHQFIIRFIPSTHIVFQIKLLTTSILLT